MLNKNSPKKSPAKRNKEKKLNKTNDDTGDNTIQEAGVISEQQMQIAVETLEDKAEVNLDLQVRS